MSQQIPISKQTSYQSVIHAIHKLHYSKMEAHVMMYLIFLIMSKGQYDQAAREYFTFFNPQPLAKHDHVSLHSVKVAFKQLLGHGDIRVNDRQHAKNQVFLVRFRVVKN
ncbi:MAG: hypothetical protein AJITA_00143 [Acetilactobacillus jinshanensis]